MEYVHNDPHLGSLSLSSDEADIVLDALQHYLVHVMEPMVDSVEPDQKAGYEEDNVTMEAIIMRLEILMSGI